MKVLVVGKGGREHALCWRLNQSPSVRSLFCATGSAAINRIAAPVDISPNDVAGLARFARSESIDLTVVGPEDPLAAGIADEFARDGLRLFGPTKAAAQLETSKSFAKEIMREAGVPTAPFEVFDNADAARSYVSESKGPVVVKADGLALGKGVTVCDTSAEALAAVTEAMVQRRFGAAGSRIVIEQRLVGEELSFFALCNETEAIPLGFVQDHKTIDDGDRGPNTGGMGAYSPVPHFDSVFERRVMDEVVHPVLRTMAEHGTPYRGVLFAGLMVDGDRINVLEFNVRFGDPECQPLMMRMECDLAEALMAVAEGHAHEAFIKLSKRSSVAVVLASGGYPGEYRKGIPIMGLEKVEGAEPSSLKVKWAADKIRIKVFHAGTALQDGRYVTDGGRVMAVTTMADELQMAVAAAYEAAELIKFEGKHLRRDIAYRALNRRSNR